MKKKLPRVTTKYRTPNWEGMDLWDMSPTQIKNCRERILEAWQLALPELMVLEHAKITQETYDSMLYHFPEFADMRMQAYSVPNMKARLNIMKDIEKGNVATSKWYLEKTDPEFSKKNVNETTVKVSVEEREERLLKSLENYGTVDFTVIEEDGKSEPVDDGEDTRLLALQEDNDKRE